MAVSYGRMLLHDTMLKSDSYRTGTAESPMCDCGQDKESVPHILLHCGRFVEARYEMEDAIEDYLHWVTMLLFVLKMLFSSISPKSAGN